MVSPLQLTKAKMQYEKLVEFPLEASLANFKSAMELFITRPHLVDKRTSGATIQSRFLSSEDSLTCDFQIYFPDPPELELTPNEGQKGYKSSLSTDTLAL